MDRPLSLCPSLSNPLKGLDSSDSIFSVQSYLGPQKIFSTRKRKKYSGRFTILIRGQLKERGQKSTGTFRVLGKHVRDVGDRHGPVPVEHGGIK